MKGPGLVQRVTLELQKITEGLPKPASIPSAVTPKPPGKQPDASPTSDPATSPPATPMEAVGPEEEQPDPPAKKLTVEVSSDPVGGLQTEFKSNVVNIYMRWQGHALPEGAKVRVAWVAEDVNDLVEPNCVIDETETAVAAPAASARFTLGRPLDGWAEKKYRVEFYIDDILVETVRVTISR